MAINNETPQNRIPPSRQNGQSFRPIASSQEQSRFNDSLKKYENQTQSKKPENQNKKTEIASQKETTPSDKKGDTSEKPETKNRQEKDAELFAWNGAVQGQSGFNAQNDMASATAHAAGMDSQLQAQLDRIAAAIAEHAANGKQGQFTVQLPAGLPIESAVLARGVNGLISVMLVARPGSLGLQERRMMRSELAERLKQRKIPMAEIGFSDRNN